MKPLTWCRVQRVTKNLLEFYQQSNCSPTPVQLVAIYIIYLLCWTCGHFELQKCHVGWIWKERKAIKRWSSVVEEGGKQKNDIFRWWRSACCEAPSPSRVRRFISGATLWTSLMIWPIILICVLKYNIQKPLMEASLPHLGAFQITEISISPPSHSGHADVLCGCRAQLNPATSKGRTSEHTVSLSQSNSRIFFLYWKFKKRKRNRKWNGTLHLVSGTSGLVLLLNNQHPFRGVVCALCR